MMRNSWRLSFFVLLALASFLTTQVTLATDIFVDTGTGGGMVAGYYGLYDPNVDDPPGGYPPTIPADLDPNVGVYFVGRTTESPVATGFTTPERRVAFLFDMSGVAASIPVGEVVADVSISLELLPGGTSALVNFKSPLEVVAFTSTPVPPEVIADPNLFPEDPNGLPAEVAIWDTLGAGDLYGDFVLPDPSDPNLPVLVPGTQEIPLSLAVPDLVAAIDSDSIFVVSMRLATYDPDPIGSGAPPAFDPYEYVFGGTDVPSGVPYPELTITTIPIPEPSSLVLAAFGVLGLGCRRRK